MFISEKTIADVKAQLRIDEVVGDFITLKKKGSGQNLWACCPFPGHNEQTPSFSIHASKGFYKCFGCGEAGDTIRFLEKVQGMSYPEAIEYIAKKYHIPFVMAAKNDKKDAKQRYKEGLYLLMDQARQFYEDTLRHSWKAQEYLAQRGITKELSQRFHLGYSPEGWRNFYDYAIKQGYEVQKLLDVGLVIDKGENICDRFRHGIIFTILDSLGRVVGFGRRTLDPTNKVKYLNSPETTIYQKSHQLYGFYQAKEAIQKHDACYVVEGYTDVIAMHKVGIQHVVASSGTSMSMEQIALIKRFTSNVILLFDGDNAGVKASFRAVDRLLQQDMDVKMIALPSGEDPASHAAKLAPQDFLHYLAENQKDFVTFKIQANQLSSNDPSHQVSMVHSIVESIACIPDMIKQAVYIDLCSRLMDIKKDRLEKALQQYQKPLKTTLKSSLKRPIKHKEEACIIEQLLHHGNTMIAENMSLADIVFSELQEITLKDPMYQAIYQQLHSQWVHEGQLSYEKLLEQTSEETQKIVIDFMCRPFEMSDNWHKKGVAPQEKQKLDTILDKNIHYLKRLFTQKLIDDEQKRLEALGQDMNPADQILYFHELGQIQMDIDRHLGIVVRL